MTKKLALYKKYFFELFVLSIPLIIGNVAQVLIGAVDVFVAAKHGLETIESISIANSIIMCVFIIGVGFMASISPVVANYRGARKPSRKYLYSSIVYSLSLSAVFGLLTIAIIPLVPYMGFEQRLVYHIQQYMFICSFSYFGAYLHFALKEFLQAYEIVIFPNAVAILAILLNLILNFVLVFGFWIIPSLGVIGLAIATLSVRTFMGVILLIYAMKIMNLKMLISKSYLKQLVKVGYPISIAMVLEFFAWNGITLIVGRVAGVYAAAQSIIITISSVTFMVPLAISNAIAIKVGYANGAMDYKKLKRFSLSGVFLTLGFMTMCAIALFLAPQFFVEIFTKNERLLKVAVPVIYVVALYQIFDGFQISLSGILKGLKMTKVVSLSTFCAYWVIGIPLGFLFAFRYNLELLGFWIALAIALLVMSIVLSAIILFKFMKLRKEYKNSLSPLYSQVHTNMQNNQY